MSIVKSQGVIFVLSINSLIITFIRQKYEAYFHLLVVIYKLLLLSMDKVGIQVATKWLEAWDEL